MKNLFLVTGIIFCFFSCKTERKKDTGNHTISNFQELKQNFVSPTKEYGTAPLYVWNTKVTKEMIDRTMLDLKDKGFGGVFIHPRPGLVTEYISQDWYDLYRYAVDKGKELGMNVWLYDENSYPSGFAGGHVPAEMPESYNEGVGLTLTKLEILPDTAANYFIYLKEDNGKFVDISSDLKAEAGKKGTYYLFAKKYERESPWYGGFSYVDLLRKGVTEKFIDITLNGHKNVVGDEFGKTLPGWFTDEPNINSHGGIRWTPDLFEVFQSQWGYDLKANLPSLCEEVGNWKQVRHNYIQTLLQLFIDRWAKPCFEYCEANNLQFTGHYWEHGWPDMGHGGDNMAMYAWHQMPAIDMLFNQFNDKDPQAQFGNVRSVKELRSAANQMGYKRTLSETYGGGGWNETFRDFKRLGDWEYVLGVNFMNQHLSHLSISGARKYDYPPTFSDHSPWWPYYKSLNMHFARLSMALSAGNQINDMLILEPTTSIWLYYSYVKSNSALWDIGNSFQTFITTLEKAQVEYDLGSENIIKDHGKIDKNKFVVGKCAYSKVVIPPLTENMEGPTFKLLKEFVEKGGVVLAFSKPTLLDGKPDAEVEQFFAENKKITFPGELTQSVIDQDFASPDIAFSNVKNGDLYHQRRVMDDGEIVFLVNSSLEQSAQGRLSVIGKDAVELNTFTGEMIDYLDAVDGEYVKLDFDLPPAGSILLYVFDKKQKEFSLPAKTGSFMAVESENPVVVSPESDNVLTVDRCDLQVGKESFKDLHVFYAADKAFKYHGFKDGNPWSTSIQYKDNTIKRDTFSTGGFKATYKFVVDGDFDKSAMKAVVERPQLYKVTLNGKEIHAEAGKWWLDRDMGEFPIGNEVKKGENQLSIEAAPMKIMAEIEPIYILGNFTVKPASKAWTIAPPVDKFIVGSWKAQGWPFYSKTVTYAKSFNISTPAQGYQVQLGDWKGTVAEVVVNGTSAGIIFAEPYSLDVSKLIQKGKNTVEVKVVGSNKNLLGPFYNNPDPGFTGPGSFKLDKPCPAGSEYQQFDYGLMNDFVLQSI